METADIMWFYSSNFSDTPDTAVSITDLPNRINGSTYTFSSDRLSLTISGIVQARSLGDPTDEGRYFFVASNPAGRIPSYVDVVVNGQFTVYYSGEGRRNIVVGTRLISPAFLLHVSLDNFSLPMLFLN